MTGLPFGELSSSFYIATHMPELAQLLEPRVRKEDMPAVIDQLMENKTYLAKLLENNFSTDEKMRYDHILEEMVSKSLLIIMMGARRHGKTATAFRLAEDIRKLKTNKEIWWFGYSPIVKKTYPWIKQTLDIKKIDNCILIFDEAAIFMMGRESMYGERQKYIKQIPVQGHNDITTIYLTQIERIDPWLWGFCDWVWFKPYPFIDWTETKLNIAKLHKFMIPNQKWQNYVFDNQEGIPYFFDNQLPEKWNSELSKPYKKIKDIKEAVKYLEELEKAGIKQRELETMVELRGWSLEELYAES